MENNNHKKRKVMLIAAFAVAVIALAGIGYATGVGYKGTTVNTGNTADGKYITVTQGGAYTGIFNTTDPIEIDTYTDNGYKTTPIFSLDDGAVIPGAASGYKGVQIGQTLTLNITGSDASATSASYTVTVKTAADALSGTTGGWEYVMVFQGSGDPVAIYNTGATFDGKTAAIATTGTITVKLYIASQTMFEEIEDAAPLVTESYVPNVGKPSAKVSPLADGKLFDDISVVFTVEGEQ